MSLPGTVEGVPLNDTAEGIPDSTAVDAAIEVMFWVCVP